MPQKPQPEFDQYLLNKAESIEKKSKQAAEARAFVAVALARRFRADSASDRFGFFSPNGTRAWLGDHDNETERLANMHFLPVIEPAVSANSAAMVTAKVQVTSEPACKKPEATGAAAVAKGVYQFLDGHEDHWSDGLEARIAHLCQTSHGYFIRSRHNPKKAGETVKETLWGEEEMPTPGEYACQHCATGGPFFDGTQQDETGAPFLPCPECKQRAEIVSEPGVEPMEVPVEEKQHNPGDSETTVHTAYEVRVDERRTQGGNLRAARWMELSRLVPQDELEAENPGFDLGSPEEWRLPMKWQHSLETGTDTFLKMSERGWADCEIFEVREIYLLPEDYATYLAPSDWQLKDGEGNVVFEIRAGERLVDLFPSGFRFSVTGRKILPGSADDPAIAPYDFRDEWTYGGFKPDGMSFWMKPLSGLLQLQDDVNELYTIDILARRRHKTSLIYDSMALDDSDFDYDLVPTKQGWAMETGDAIERHFAAVQPPAERQAMEGLGFLMGILPQVGAPPPAASGAPDPTEDTYRGQLLKRQAALGLLAPAGQSKAKAKVCWFKQQLKLAQKWPRERFEYIRARFGEEWKEQDIEAFVNGDLDKLLDISYVEGSEVPVTMVERRILLGEVLTQIGTVLQAAKEAGDYEDDVRELVAKYIEAAGIEHDIGNTEADQRLAETRYRRIREGLRKHGEAYAPEEALAIVMTQPGLMVLPKENHGTHIEFWADRQRALLGEDVPDELLIMASSEMIRRHEASGVYEAQHQLENEMAAQEPLMQMQAEQSAAAAEAENAKAEAERADEAARAEEDREHQIGMEAMKLASQERQAAQPAQA